MTNETNKRMVEKARELIEFLEKEFNRIIELPPHEHIKVTSEFATVATVLKEMKELRSLIEGEVKREGSTNVSPTASPMEVEWIDGEKDELYCYFAACPKCGNGNVIKGSSYCSKCGIELIWPTEDEKKEEVVKKFFDVKDYEWDGENWHMSEKKKEETKIELLKAGEGSVND